MAGKHDDHIIRYAEGRQDKGGKHNRGKVNNLALPWGLFRKKFDKPTRTAETIKQFDKLSQDEQHELKAIDGYIMGAQMKDGVRRRANIRPRDMISYDFDHMDDGFVSRMKYGALPISDKEFFAHTTRRHRKGAPRIRMFFPLTRSVSADEYGPLSRILSFVMEDQVNPMPLVDKVSFRPAQLMYKPTVSKDGEYWTHHNTGDLIDPDELFEWFDENYGDHNDYNLLPRTVDEGDLRKAADKAEDPTTKRGPVGDWCRAYDVIEVIDKFLSDKYARTDEHSEKPRYTYLLGTSSSGAVVEDNGLFLYSHHGSDPCAEMLVNAFDLPRVHLFGDLDEGVDPKETPPNQMPSYKAMVKFAMEDEGYRHSQAASRYDIAAMFEDVVDDDGDSSVYTEDDDSASEEDAAGSIADKFDDLDEDAAMDAAVRRLLGSGAGSPADNPPKKKRKKAPKTEDWFPDALTLDQNGKIESTMPNAAVIIHNDARMFGAIAFNEFSKQIVSRRSIKSRLDIAPSMIVRDTENGDPWQDFNDITIRMILEAPNGEGKVGYGMPITDRNLAGAIVSASRRNAFHPIRDMLEDAAERYGADVELLETLFIRFLGVEDNAYHRETARLVLVASVARIFEPGHKFDFAPILQGETGIRKSSFIKFLYGAHYFGEIDCNLADTQAVAELIAGIWGGELSELAGFHKADHNSAKSFMRRVKDKVRMAYDRRVSEFPRQMIVWGSTNDKKYLKDPTGNRSYWPILVQTTEIDTDGLERDRLRIWAAAVHLYREMRAEQPKGDLPLYLRNKASQQEALRLQEDARTEELHEIWADKIADWLDEDITLAAFFTELGLDPDEHFIDDGKTSPHDVLVQRCAFHRDQAVEIALKKDRGVGDYQTAQNIGRAIPEIKGWYQKKAVGAKGGHQERVQGKLARWHFREAATPEERKQGYRLVPSASAGDSDFSHLI